jgi:hypothetical protein
MTYVTGLFFKRAFPAVFLLGAGALNSGCDWGFRGIAATSFGIGYNDREDRTYCRSAYPNWNSNGDRDFNSCLSSRNVYRSSYNDGRHSCRYGGSLTYRNVCHNRIGYWGVSNTECINMPSCSDGSYFPRNEPSGQGVTSQILLFPSLEAVHLNKVNALAAPSKLAIQNTLLRATSGRTLGESVESVGPESVAVADSVSLASSTIVRNALMQAFDKNRAPLIALGFADDEVEEFMVRQDPSGASTETYAKVAQRLDMPAAALRSFVGNVLGLVVDTRWEIYNAENPSP